MNKNIYLRIDSKNEELLYYLNKIFSPTKSELLDSDILFMEIDDSIVEQIDSIRSFESDFFVDISAYVDDVNLPDNLLKYVFEFLSLETTGIYKLTNVLEKIVLNNNKPGIQAFKKYFSTKLPKEIIDTGLGFIKFGNSIAASKELYIHRNTLNYRIENIKKITSLDLKKFNDQLAFYGLFH